MLKHSPGMEARLRNMPLFCVETALKLLLWSDVVYECVVDQDGPLGPQKQVYCSKNYAYYRVQSHFVKDKSAAKLAAPLLSRDPI